MTTPTPTGWNTWDVRYHTGWAHLPDGPRVRFGLRGPDGAVFDGFTWRHGLVRLGHHTVDGGYAAVDVSAHDTTLRLECAGGGELSVRADRDGPAALVVFVDGAEGWRVDCAPEPTTVEPGRLVFEGGGTVTVRVLPAAAVPDEPVTARIAAAGRAAARIRTGGWLGDSADAMTRALTWNTIYAPDLGRVLTPTSRDFVCREREGFYGSWALHTWDTFFTGLVAAWVDPSYARDIFGQILDHATPAGMLPNRVSDDRGRTDDRSQPPVGAYTVLKAYLGSGLSDRTRRTDLLRSTYPALAAWHAWWAPARTGAHGLLAWGSDPVDGDPESATLDRAKRESGLDDSPMYDDAVLDPATHTMNLADVGLNALHTVDAEALALIAERLGEPAAPHRAAARARGQAVDEVLWDHDAGLYRNRWAGGTHSDHTSPTLLYPLLAGIPDAARAAAVADLLLRPGTLGGDPPLPSTARDDPGFSSRYWRGRVWAPMAFLAVEGLRRNDLDAHSRPIVAGLLKLFLREWHEHSHVRENYPVNPGEDVRPLAARSDGLMGWGGLLAYLAIQELADARPDGWRFGHPGEDATVDGLALAEGRLSVHAGRRLVVALDAAPLLDVPRGVTVTGYARDDDSVRGVLHGVPDDAGEPLIAVPAAARGRRSVVVRAGDAVREMPVGPGGMVNLVMPGARPLPFEVRPHETGE